MKWRMRSPISFKDILDANALQITELVPLGLNKTTPSQRANHHGKHASVCHCEDSHYHGFANSSPHASTSKGQVPPTLFSSSTCATRKQDCQAGPPKSNHGPWPNKKPHEKKEHEVTQSKGFLAPVTTALSHLLAIQATRWPRLSTAHNLFEMFKDGRRPTQP